MPPRILLPLSISEYPRNLPLPMRSPHFCIEKDSTIQPCTALIFYFKYFAFISPTISPYRTFANFPNGYVFVYITSTVVPFGNFFFLTFVWVLSQMLSPFFVPVTLAVNVFLKLSGVPYFSFSFSVVLPHFFK